MATAKSHVRVYAPRTTPPAGPVCVSTTADAQWSPLSASSLGAVTVTPGTRPRIAQNAKNAWLFSKVYADHVDPAGKLTPAHARWALAGWAAPQALRSPELAKPLYSIWRNRRLGRFEARRCICIPAYVEGLIRSSDAPVRRLLQVYRTCCAEGKELALFGDDGYDHVAKGRTLADVFLCQEKAGCSFILAALLEGRLAELGDELNKRLRLPWDAPPLPNLAALAGTELLGG